MPHTMSPPVESEKSRGELGARRLSLAFLGCGAIAIRHSHTLRALGANTSCFYASRNPARSREFSRRLGGAGAFGGYQAALSDPRIDVAVITNPPVYHLDLTLQALAQGKHVIVEKPAFLRAADCEKVAAAAAAAGRRVLVAENYAYKPLTRLLQQVMGSGELGEVLFVQVNATKLRPVQDWRGEITLSGGGALFEGGVHWLHLMGNLGLRVESVQGFRPGALGRSERSMLVVLQYEEGAVGTLTHSWETPALLRGLRLSKISGTHGSVTFESNGLFAAVRGKRTRLLIPGLGDIGGYREMFRDFLSTLRTGAAPRMTLERARQDLQLVEAAYGSVP